MHGERAEKRGHGGKEYWSPRPGNFYGPAWGNKQHKVLTHRLERRQADRELQKEVKEIKKAA